MPINSSLLQEIYLVKDSIIYMNCYSIISVVLHLVADI